MNGMLTISIAKVKHGHILIIQHLKVLTIHSIIVKNSLLMHKIKFFSDTLPVSIVDTISNDSPVNNEGCDRNMN